MSSFLALLRLSTSNRLSSLIFKALTKEYLINGEKRVLIDDLFALYAGLPLRCSLTTHLMSELFNLWLKFSLAVLRTDEELVKNMLRDSSVRRGIILMLKTIAEHGFKVPFKLHAPFFVVWNFTNMCNLKCMHCYQKADKPLPDELTLKEKLKVIDELDSMYVCGIALSGGEPTIHPDFLTIIHEISSRGMYAAVATNGIAFASEEFTLKTKKAGIKYVEISLDSSKPEIHDKFRGVKNAWRKAVKGVENCVKYGITTAIATTVTKMNIDDIENILDLAESLSVKRVVFFNFVPVGRGKENIYLDLSPEEREEVLKLLYREALKRKIEIVSTAPQYGRVVVQESSGRYVSPTHFTPVLDSIIHKAVVEFIGGCGAGRVYAAIEPNGIVTPCVFMPIPLGSVRREGFSKIWKEHSLLNSLRDRTKLKGVCRVCKFRDVCGGCRARAYAYYNDPLQSDPGCIYCRKYWIELWQKVHVLKITTSLYKEMVKV